MSFTKVVPLCCLIALSLAQMVYAGLEITSIPSAVSLAPGGATAITLRVNNSGLVAEELFVWQVGLSIVPNPGAIAAVTFTAFGQPTDYVLAGNTLFGPTLAFGSTLPSAMAVWSDVSSGPSGGVISASSSRNLLELTISASANAIGDFHIELTPFDADPDKASMWLGGNSPFPVPFDNAGPGASISQRTVMSISVQPVPEPAGQLQALMCAGLGCLIRRTRIRWRTTVT